MLNSLFIDQRCLFGRVEAAMQGLSYVDIRYNRRLYIYIYIYIYSRDSRNMRTCWILKHIVAIRKY